MENWLYGCNSCSKPFASRSVLVGYFEGPNQPPIPARTQIFSRAKNVYWEEQVEDPITIIMDQQRRVPVTFTKVYCSGCGSHCGWKILSIHGQHPLMRAGQFMLCGKRFEPAS